MAFDPVSGDLWEQENGDDTFDEINRVERGMNGGWVQLAEHPADVKHRLPTTLPVAHFSDPEFSWKWAVPPGGIGFVDGNGLGEDFGEGERGLSARSRPSETARPAGLGDGLAVCEPFCCLPFGLGEVVGLGEGVGAGTSGWAAATSRNRSWAVCFTLSTMLLLFLPGISTMMLRSPCVETSDSATP